jgi:flagellar hook-associated protein 2
VSSPITFSGVNGVDFSQILNAVMSQEQAPLNALQTQKTNLQSQGTIFGTLATKLSQFQASVEALSDEDSLASLSATSSDAGVGVSTTTGTVPGTYEVVVSQLARAQVLSSTTQYTGLDAVAATGGALTITPKTGDPIVVSLTDSTSLESLVAKINATEGSPVSAAAVQTSTGIYRLVLTGKQTGLDNGFTVTSTLSGGTGVGFADTNGDGTYGDSAADNVQNALDAQFTVNNLAVTSASNTVTSVIPGVTLTLKKTDPATTVTIGVARDSSTSKNKVKAFISAYNDIMTFAKDQSAAAGSGKVSIGRDPLLRSLRDQLRGAVQGAYSSGNSFTQLAAVGVGFDTNGKMTLDETVFDAAMAASPTDVQGLFSGADGTGGVFGSLSKLATSYTQAGGLLSGATTRLTAQVSGLVSRMDRMSAQLDIRRQSLQREYIAADMAMSQMKSAGSSLSSIGSEYRLF